jgi:hypothetical protein
MDRTDAEQCSVEATAAVDASPDLLFGDIDGHPLAMAYTIGFLDGLDGGPRWFPLRGFFADTTRSSRPMEGVPGGDYTLAPEAATAYAGAVLSGRHGDTWGYRRPDGAPLLTLAGSSLQVREGDFVALDGERVGTACRWHARHRDHPMIYTSQPFRVSGHVRGAPVSGVYFVETMHTVPGKSFFPSPYLDGLQIALCSYVNELSDGTWESGALVAGFDGFEAVVVQQNGAPVVETGKAAFSCEIEDREPAFPSVAEFHGAGETLTWRADANGRWPVMTHLHEGHRIRHGTVTRAGCEVPVRRSYAYLESYLPRIARAAALA